VSSNLIAGQLVLVPVSSRSLSYSVTSDFRLENWQFEEWGSQVTVVSSDMREWVAPEKADIIVSELLGSFADNELSPECLDGAQHFLKGLSRLGGNHMAANCCLLESKNLQVAGRGGARL
jgi:hypothetical protein